ncbi:MAG: formate dehydrogenase accessory sulfurtransferase FdhD [Candidatus Aminicenantes bacterium]|nr:formate dehydrogenase accessory sulfurtransferase FdhD [Acidobacteriota bacterium]MBU4404632.1 formate dehydrogenase accessory sulfurtransferase FdhD [Acidobacteriota bacterium]MCG2810232.1 formate dehydrogenase accessory sulfurtransferase FdhD [Candidatus Aminicenantes bacterium]
MSKVEDEYTREVDAWQYRSGFTAIDEKLIDDVFLELSINGKLQDSILTIRDNLRLLAMGHFFLSLRIRPEHILHHVSIHGLKAELTLAENIMESHYQNLCYKRVCSCRPSGARAAASTFLPDNELTLAADKVRNIYGDFQDSSALFKETGGVHGAALYNSAGEKAAFFKDISRHNCFSKTVGFLIENISMKTTAGPVAMMVSCRVNQEIVRMAQRAGIKVLLIRAAPSLSAYREALQSGLTLVGFVKEERFTVFTGRKRIVS